MKRLSGKVALVTGGSRGIGAAIAKRLAEEGADVAITYTAATEKAHEVVHAIESSGVRGIAFRADSGSESDVKEAVSQTVRHLGALDILVNNAGIVIVAPIDTVPLADFDLLVAVNIRGVFVATQEALRIMKDGGRVINVGSAFADSIPFPGFSVYTMTKTALVGLTRGLARDLGTRGITVNNVQPGSIDTDTNPADGPYGDTMRAHTPISRYGRSEEVAGMVAYLASPEAALVTGASLTIDGGFSA
jgi:3-oxoacyl-[acyl-carrier protein] reductase